MSEHDESTTSSDGAEDSPVIRDMRKAIKSLTAERDALKAKVRGSVLGDVFTGFGLDPSSGPGKFVADAYDGDLDADAVKGWLEEQGFNPAEQQQAPAHQAEPEGLAARVEQRQKLDTIQRDSVPAEKQKMSVDEHRALLKTDPQAAMAAFRDGRVAFSDAAQAAASDNPTRMFG